jgi:hypothetical protein
MRKKLRGALLALAPLILANCVGVEPQGRLAHSGKAELLARLQLGQPALDCREPCLSEWRRVQPMAAQLDAATNWDDLAVLVMRSGYQDDLSLYYLGRAAEGRGFYGAAASYYRRSMQLSGTSVSCMNLSHLCGGVTLPKTAAERLAMAERLLIPRKTRPRQPATNSRPPEASQAGAAELISAAEPPQTTAATPLVSPSQPATMGNPEPAGDTVYIEPPPASR